MEVSLKPVSKDHKRVNRNGVNLEQLDKMKKSVNYDDLGPFRGERHSVDIAVSLSTNQIKENSPHPHRKLSHINLNLD